MAEAASSILSVAITRNRTGYLTLDESEKMLDAIHKQIISEACSTKQDEEDRKILSPIFEREPQFEDGAIKMWCGNEQTLTWLKLAVSTYDQSLVVKNQSEIQNRHTCRLVIRDEQRLIDLINIESVLCYQNSWIDFKRWEVGSHCRQGFNVIFEMSIPDDQVLHLLKVGRHLSIGLSMVKVQFLASKTEEFGDIIPSHWSNFPQDWDPITERFLKNKKQ